MLKITIPEQEYFDEAISEFITIQSFDLVLEHSLVSLSKWEAKWHKAFLTKGDKPREEILDYIRAMTITQNVKDNLYDRIPKEIIDQITDYISDSMTATTFGEEKVSKANSEIITSEIIYYWMTHFQIPFECQKWHLNRLLTLIKVCNIKSTPPKKMTRAEVLSRNRALNDARREKLKTTG